jgi:hypothetical protein
MLDWLTTPLSGASTHDIAPWAYWHGRCMVLAWGVLIPVGALVARYFKVTKRQRWPVELDNKGWWHAHRALQWLGVLLMSLGVSLSWGEGSGETDAARLHAWGGWALVCLGWLQVMAGLGRGSKGGPTEGELRGDHYDMTNHRVWFERMHKSLGWLSVVAAVGVIALGLHIADAPRWMALVLPLWWLGLAACAWIWQRQGRCIDTYQAIWGPSTHHPGNRIKPVGWGVRRLKR